MTAWLLDLPLALGLFGAGAATLTARSLFGAVLGFISTGLIAALVWVRLEAPDVALTEAVIAAASRELNLPRETMLEDMGTALVSHRDRDGLRRLLRFGGVSFRDFLQSVEELPDRARLALPDLHLPDLQLSEDGGGAFTLTAAPPFDGAGYLLIGLLRAMADDYGALVVLDMAPSPDNRDVISILLLDEAHAEGRRFDLAMGAA